MKSKFSFRYVFLASAALMTAPACSGDPISLFLIGVSLGFWCAIGVQEPLEEALRGVIDAQDSIIALQERTSALQKTKKNENLTQKSS